ncbi:MAG: hypothetical protein HYS80_01875 [Candidatus Aenigmarchaeota archaeon]|nr:hypothetical protein [Candidatus Aenigmarchaeota archaeon]
MEMLQLRRKNGFKKASNGNQLAVEFAKKPLIQIENDANKIVGRFRKAFKELSRY